MLTAVDDAAIWPLCPRSVFARGSPAKEPRRANAFWRARSTGREGEGERRQRPWRLQNRLGIFRDARHLAACARGELGMLSTVAPIKAISPRRRGTARCRFGRAKLPVGAMARPQKRIGL